MNLTAWEELPREAERFASQLACLQSCVGSFSLEALPNNQCPTSNLVLSMSRTCAVPSRGVWVTYTPWGELKGCGDVGSCWHATTLLHPSPASQASQPARWWWSSLLHCFYNDLYYKGITSWTWMNNKLKCFELSISLLKYFKFHS